jgi:hypothetical protein
MIATNKMVNEEICEEPPTDGAFWWSKLEACPMLEEWLVLYVQYVMLTFVKSVTICTFV